MTVFKYAVVAALLCGTVPAAQADPARSWAPHAHNTFAITDDPDPNIPPPPPPTPFCTPRGGLFIVGPICDEIGVGPPRKQG